MRVNGVKIDWYHGDGLKYGTWMRFRTNQFTVLSSNNYRTINMYTCNYQVLWIRQKPINVKRCKYKHKITNVVHKKELSALIPHNHGQLFVTMVIYRMFTSWHLININNENKCLENLKCMYIYCCKQSVCLYTNSLAAICYFLILWRIFSNAATITKTIINNLSEVQQSVTFSNRLLKVENSLSAHECKKLHAQMGTRSQIY